MVPYLMNIARKAQPGMDLFLPLKNASRDDLVVIRRSKWGATRTEDQLLYLSGCLRSRIYRAESYSLCRRRSTQNIRFYFPVPRSDGLRQVGILIC